MRQKQAHIIIVTKSVPKRFATADRDNFTYSPAHKKRNVTF